MGEQETTIGIVGLGEVGLRLAVAFADQGYDVVGVDIDEERVESIRAGRSYIRDVDDQAVKRLRDAGVRASTSYESLTEATFISVCVPTPLRKSGNPDVSYVVDAVENLAEVLDTNATVVIESTVYPGATETLVADVFAEQGFTVGEDIYLGSSPERIDPGNSEWGLVETPKVLGGVTRACGDRIQAVYETVFDDLVRVDSATEAEMAKILENTFRNVNIALVNEFVKVADNMDVNVWNVIDAAATKPYGFMSFYPGPGLGGHCIPVDPLYLSWQARQRGLDTPLIDLADRTNRDMSGYVVDRVDRQLDRAGKPVSKSSILVVGVAYKPDIPDTRNSPGIDVMKHLHDRGSTVSYHDPLVSTITVPEVGTFQSETLDESTLLAADSVVIVTDHTDVDVELIVETAPLVFDTRNCTADYDADHIERL